MVFCRSFLLSGRNLPWPRRMLPLVSHGKHADEIDRRTDGRQTVTLRFPLDAASVIEIKVQKNLTTKQTKWTLRSSHTTRPTVFTKSFYNTTYMG